MTARRVRDALPFPLLLLFLFLARQSLAARVPALRPTSSAPLTIDQLRQLSRAVGFIDPDTAAAVAMAESCGNPAALGDKGDSIGLWQINVPAHPESDRSRLMDPEYNAREALRISKRGADWSKWTCYRNGGFRKYLPPL